MDEKMRVTHRSQRGGSARHNDRTFEAREEINHIDQSKTKDNVYLSFIPRSDNESFKDAELSFYKERYEPALQARNERYKKQAHPDRVRTIEQVYTGKKTRPEEIILQVGKKGNHVSPDTLKQITGEYLQELTKWNKSHGEHMKLLDVAIHNDEATPHVHIRRVWECEKDGVIELLQNQALKEAGIDLPNPNKPESRYNNRKMTFDAMMLDKLQAICMAHGLDIETEPRTGVRHLTTAEYKSAKLQEQEDALKGRIKALLGNIRSLRQEQSNIIAEYEQKAPGALDWKLQEIRLQEVTSELDRIKREHPSIFEKSKSALIHHTQERGDVR